MSSVTDSSPLSQSVQRVRGQAWAGLYQIISRYHAIFEWLAECPDPATVLAVVADFAPISKAVVHLYEEYIFSYRSLLLKVSTFP